MQHLDQHQRLYIDPDRKGAVIFGEQPGVVAVASKDNGLNWSWAVYDIVQTHRGRAESLDAAEYAIMAKLAEIDALAAATEHALTERQRDELAFDHERQNYRGGDPKLANLYRLYNARADANAMRAVSHPSYHLSGTKTRDDAALASLRVRIEARKAELAQREAA